MIRSYGKVFLKEDKWVLEAEPHIAILWKRMFPQAARGDSGVLKMSDNDATRRNIEWFVSRYTLTIEENDRKAIRKGAKRHEDTILRLEQIIDKDYKPLDVRLVLPPRNYQKIAAEIALKKGSLLLADDVGLGKSCSAICTLPAAWTLPAIVVTLAGAMPAQWQEEIAKFMPQLFTHVVKRGTPYELPEKNGRGPDVVILNYHKLSGWDNVLKKYGKSIIFDEVQELRHSGSDKYLSAKNLAEGMKLKLGLSVGPDSMVLVRNSDGIRHLRIDDFSKSVGAIDDIFTPIEGHEVRAFDGKTFVWKKIKSVLKHKLGEKKAFRVHVQTGRSVVVTEDHSVFKVSENGTERVNVRPYYYKPIAKLEEVKGSDLMVGDFLLLEDFFDVKNPISEIDICDYITASRWFVNGDFKDWINENVTSEKGVHGAVMVRYRQITVGHRGTYVTGAQFMSDPALRAMGGKIYTQGKGHIWTSSKIPISSLSYLLGFYLGDGWLSESRICFAVENARVKDFLEKLDVLKPWMSVNPSVRQMPGKSAEIRFGNLVFSGFLRGFFRNAKAWEKDIPEEVFSFDRENVRKFVQGMLDSDGHLELGTRDRRRWYYTTTSEKLAVGLCELLKRIGILAGLYKADNRTGGGIINGRQINGIRPKYMVHFSDYDWQGLNHGSYGRRPHFYMGDISGYPGKIRKIEPENPEYVYDISVEGDDWQTFVASGILVHNSATPIFNFGGEIYNVIQVLDPDALGTPDEFFRTWCSGQYRNHSIVRDPKALGSYLRENFIMLRRTRKDVGRELPPLQKIPQHIESDPEELDKIHDSAAELAKIILSQGKKEEGEVMRAGGQLSVMLRQATGIGKAPYVADFIRLLVDSGEKVLCFLFHREVYSIVMSKLEDLKPAMFTGSETPAEKIEARRRFIAGETPVLLMSLRAGAGLDGLQKMCRTVVFGELDWAPAVHEQNIGRVFRDGQTDPVTAYFLVADDGADPLIAEKLGLKRQQAEGIRNPDHEILEDLQVDKGRAIELAKMFLKNKNIPEPVEES